MVWHVCLLGSLLLNLVLWRKLQTAHHRFLRQCAKFRARTAGAYRRARLRENFISRN